MVLSLMRTRTLRSYRICRDETADDDAVATANIPHHRLADGIAAIADHRMSRYFHPDAFNGNPVGAVAHVIFGAMPIGHIATRYARGADDALEPVADVVRDIAELTAIHRMRGRSKRHGHREKS